MKFVPNRIYHIYNQGNNKQPIFFQERNYDYFLKKMKKHVLPHVDLIAYCLMPNHFHWLVKTRISACVDSNGYKPCKLTELEFLKSTSIFNNQDDETVLNFIKLVNVANRQQRLCHEIGQLLSSYTKAINNQEGRSGSLFRKRTNAKDGANEIIESENIQSVNEAGELCQWRYVQNCFDYIHQNPVKAGLVDTEVAWKYSSAGNYLFQTSDDFIDMKTLKELSLTRNVVEESFIP